MANELDYLKFPVGELEANLYIIWSISSRKAVILDPGAWSTDIEAKIEELKLIPEKIILTHGHIDHCGGVESAAALYKIPVSIHKNELPVLNSEINKDLGNSLGVSPPEKIDYYIKEGDSIILSDTVIKIIETPGHTPGSICLYSEKLLFTGDTLFCGSIGRTDLPGGDYTEITRSLDRLKKFPPNTIILPGHGDISTLESELELNPFL